MGYFPEEAGGEPAFEAALGHSVAFGYLEAGAGLETLGQLVVDGFLHPGEVVCRGTDELTVSLDAAGDEVVEEIAAYLAKHPCDDYVILDDDDDDDMLPSQRSHFVHVNEELGLTDADVEKCIEILGAI